MIINDHFRMNSTGLSCILIFSPVSAFKIIINVIINDDNFTLICYTLMTRIPSRTVLLKLPSPADKQLFKAMYK